MSDDKKLKYVSLYSRKGPNLQRWPTKEEAENGPRVEDPALQNIPVPRTELGDQLREAFAPKRKLPEVDYSKIELRVFNQHVADACEAEEHFTADELEEAARREHERSKKDR